MPGSDHGRTQTLLLISKLLDSHQGLSPLTLIIDSLEQSAGPILQECIARAERSKIEVLFVAFETLRPPPRIKTFIAAHALSLAALSRDIRTHTQQPRDSTKRLIIIDSLHPLLSDASVSPPQFLLPLVTPSTSLLAVYHADQPLAPPSQPTSPYSPPPAKLIRFLATTVFTMHALSHVLAAQSARQRSLPGPLHGLREDAEGIICGLKPRTGIQRAVVVEMDHRRKSGRSVGALFVLRDSKSGTKSSLCLLDEDPDWKDVVGDPTGDVAGRQDDAQNSVLSFSLGLTDKQRQDREGVVLPYFDAQRDDGGPGEGGRILYDMGVEDDFDEEEDEI